MSSPDAAVLKSAAVAAIDAAAGELNDISQKIWEKPELCYAEHAAHDLLADYLEGKGFVVERKLVVDTAFRATCHFGAGPNIGVLCEYDALPGIGHACGHNLIAELGIAAALGIKAALELAGRDVGKLTVLGCPAEEGEGGKVLMRKAGLFSPLSTCLMAHPWGKVTSATFDALCRETVRVTYRGRASHAAAAPWEGVNALDAAVQAYTAVSCLRQHMKPAWRVHGVITNGGERPNIIPEESALEFYLRTPSVAEMCVLKEKMTACFQGAATVTGCQLELEWDDRPYENMVNSRGLVDLYKNNAAQLGIEFSDMTSGVPTGSTDMGNVSHVVPSIHPMFCIGTEAAPHTRDFTAAAGSLIAQPYTLAQGKALAMTALDVYCQPILVDTLADDLRQDLALEGYTATRGVSVSPVAQNV